MLTVALVVMVMFLFLRNLSATIIPSVAVPLSLVGTFGVMYLLGYSLNNLTLMALTISTGFVVDDAIVMIENITPLHRSGREAARRGAQRVRANRLHHRLADRLADCRPDSSAVHGRYRGPAVSRICGHAERHHPGLGRGFADADADDVLQAVEAHAGGEPGTLLSRIGTRIQCGDRLLRQDAASGCCAISRHAAGRRRHARLDHLSVLRHSQRLFPDSGYRRDPGRFRSGPVGLLPGDVQRAAAA